MNDMESYTATHTPNWIKQLCEEDKCLKDASKNEQVDIIEVITTQMAQSFKGFHWFWENRDKKQFYIPGWVSSLASLKISAIMRTLNIILNGQTRFSPRPPTSGMEFFAVYEDLGKYRIPPPSKYLLEETPGLRTESERLFANSQFDNMYKMLNCQRSVKTHEELYLDLPNEPEMAV